MFGKKLGRELLQYLRCLWVFMIAVIGIAFLERALLGKPIELTLPIALGMFFVLMALMLLGGGLFYAAISFSKNVLKTTETRQPLKRLLAVQILAFVIFALFAVALIYTGVSIFAWKHIGRMFWAFDAEWPYFLELLLYIPIILGSLYIVSIASVIAFHFDKAKDTTLGCGLLTAFLCLATVPMEVMLLMHSPSTDMRSLWGSTIACLIIIILLDIRMALSAYRTLKTPSDEDQSASDEEQNDNE